MNNSNNGSHDTLIFRHEVDRYKFHARFSALVVASWGDSYEDDMLSIWATSLALGNDPTH